MRIELDPVLLEDVVFLAIRHREQLGDQPMVEQYHHRVDALYNLPHDNDLREIAFRDVHAEFFHKLGFQGMILHQLAEFPLLERELERVTFLKAAARKQEGAELFVRQDGGTGGRQNRVAVVRLRAELFLDLDQLSILLRYELYHISDMVDPAFGYRPDLGETGDSIAQQNLVRDRYRVLWSMYIDARLVRTDRAPATVLNEQQGPLKKAFDGFPEADVLAIFKTVSHAGSLTHADLLRLAKTGSAKMAPGTVGGDSVGDNAQTPVADGVASHSGSVCRTASVQ
jgi:hypothetical protein